MSLLGRRGELAELDQLLDRAAGGSGGVLVLVGPAGSGRTALADLSAERAGHLGFDVLRLAAAERGPGTWMVAQLLRDVAAPEDLVTRLLAGPAPQDLDAAAVLLCSGPPRLVVLDDADRGGHEALQLLAVLAGRAASGRTAVLVTSSSTLGVGHEVGLRPLTPEQVGRAVGETRPEVQKALWAASGGLPGRARALAATLADLPGEADPVVELALRTDSAERFLGVDTGLVLLLESALRRTDDAGPRARLLARLAYALLGDAQAADRRRGLIEEALSAARRSADPAVLAEVLDARLHALWDAAGAHDRLTTADEIAELARGSAQPERERRALFWRFVALMELARVPEAESALAAFERQARLAGDAAAEVMAASRHAMLATLHGRFDDAQRLIDHVAEQGTRIRLADTPWLVGSLRAALGGLRGDPPIGEPGMEQLRAAARTNPGHLYEATTARALLSAGRTAEAAMELERALPLVLAGAGPRWLGAAADLAMVATATRATSAADALYTALIPFRGQLVVWAGANTCTGQVDYHLGLLAAELGRPDDAVALLEDAVALAESIGALPWLPWTLVALADVLSRRSADGGRDADLVARHRRRAREIAQRLGMPGPLRELSPPAEEWTLRRDDADWVLTAGEEHARVPDSRGMGYLRLLLAAPGEEISCLDLAAGGAGLRATEPEPLLDAAARDAYRRRLAALDAELDGADAAGDPRRAQRAEDERRALVDQLRRASALGGRPRPVAAEEERARINVTRTVRAAIDRLAVAAPAAGAHLTSSVRTGRNCRYQPAVGGPTRWHV